MISPSPMRKLEMLILKDDKDLILNELYDLESLEVIECEKCTRFPVPSATRESVSKAIQLDRMLNFLGHYAPDNKGSFIEAIKGKAIEPEEIEFVSAEELIVQAEAIIHELDPQIKAIERDIGDIEEEMDSIDEHVSFMEDIEGVEMDMQLMRPTDKTLKVVGRLNEQDPVDISKAVCSATDGYCSVSFWKNFVFIATLRERERSIDMVFSSFSIKRVPVPDLAGMPRDVIPALRARREELVAKRGERVDRILELHSAWDKKLRIVKELLEIEAEKSNAFRKMAATKTVIAVEGFIPAKKEKEILSRLLPFERIIIKVKDPEVEPSILLSNSGFFKPFESLTELYGLPGYKEIDPTKFFAIFFTLFFGIMMTDFVYGIVIAVIGFMVARMIKEGGVHDVASILFYGGIATAVCGVAFGSYFGDFVTSEDYLNMNLPKIVDPLYGAMEILIFSLAIGIVHLIVSNLLGFYQRNKNVSMLSAVIENLSWLLLMFGIVGAAAAMGLGMSTTVISAMAGVPIALSLIIVMVNGIRDGMAGLITGFMSFPGFMGNWLSYARLLAMALSTAGIGMVVNLFASMMWGIKIGGIQIGVVLGVVMFFGGHLFNMAINGLGAFVHSLRLHYVEFFSYFYNADGKKFEPLQIKRTYTKISKRG
ncbi:MAG: V-type ATP synthase subunit I [Candidatus Methanofastidiosa archaeon]|nr:V-type ATP synthase subunit I [Candidatus Methanofastidiosa archaeon]